MADIVSRQLAALARRPLGDVVDAAPIRRFILTWDGFDRELVAEALIAGGRRAERQLGRQRRSLLELFGAELAGDVDALLAADLVMPPYAEELLTELMEQEFVRRLLTDLIFTAIAAFYRRVNPLFGAMATRVLEDQIKGFIGLFLPTLQRQAVAFATSRTNQRVALECVRAIARQLLDQPLSRYANLVSASDRHRVEDLLRKVLRARTFDAAVRRAAVAVWDDLYARTRHQTIAKLVNVRRLAGWLTRRIFDVLEAAIAHPDVARLIADEAALANGRARRHNPARAGL